MQTMYEAHGLKKWYGGKPALNGVEFSVQPGRLVQDCLTQLRGLGMNEEEIETLLKEVQYGNDV